MVLATQPKMTLEDYLDYDDGTDKRYELVDGVLVEMGGENPINGTIAMFLVSCFLQLGVEHYRLAIGHQIAVSSKKATARQPDLIVHTEESVEAIFSGSRILMPEMPAPALVVEVVSSSDTDQQSYRRDYKEKRNEYAERGIPEYWIIDPVAAIVIILKLEQGKYQEQQFTGNQQLISPTFPQLELNAAQILSAGR